MSDLISRAELAIKIKNCWGFPIFTSSYSEADKAVNSCLRAIENAPIVDAVEVVRCKDCKKQKTQECALFLGNHKVDGVLSGMWCSKAFSENFYCADGERKEVSE